MSGGGRAFITEKQLGMGSFVVFFCLVVMAKRDYVFISKNVNKDKAFFLDISRNHVLSRFGINPC